MILKFSLFNTPRHRTLTYTPWLWNSEKEEWRRRIEEEVGATCPEEQDKGYQPNLKRQFRKNLISNRNKIIGAYSRRLSTIIMLITIAVLFCHLLHGKTVPVLVHRNTLK